MTRSLKVKINETISEIETRLSKSKTAREKERLLLLYWLVKGTVSSRKDLKELLGRDVSTITRWIQLYREGGLEKLLEEKSAPGKAPKIDGEVLKGLKARLEDETGFKSYGEIQKWLKEKYQLSLNYKTVHKTVRYKLGGKLKVARPYSVNKDEKEEINFKKKLKVGLPILYSLLGKGEKLLYFCQDETRLGLKTIGGKKITLKGIKPVGKVQWKRDNFYLYGAVEIRSGKSYFYEFSHLDKECFQLFINQLSEEFSETLNILQLDNASFHRNINFPENIIPIFQPPYSPELNPIERFWQELKRELKWENCQNLDELREKVSQFLGNIESEAIASLIRWDYLIDVVLSASS